MEFLIQEKPAVVHLYPPILKIRLYENFSSSLRVNQASLAPSNTSHNRTVTKRLGPSGFQRVTLWMQNEDSPEQQEQALRLREVMMQYTPRLVCAKDSKGERYALFHPKEAGDFCAFISETGKYLSLWEDLLCTCQAWGPPRPVSPLYVVPQLCGPNSLF